MGHIPIANYFSRIVYSKLVWGGDNFWWGRINYSESVTIKQTEEAGFFYAQNTLDNNENSWGAGINMWDWLGIEFGVNGSSNKLNVYGAVNVTPWLHGSVSIGLNGITLSLGLSIDNTSYDFTIGIGLGLVVIVGGIIMLVSTAGQTSDIVFNWFKTLFGF